MVRGFLLSGILLIAAAVSSHLVEESLPAGIPEISAGEFVTVVLLAPARPIAVALLWSRSVSLRTQRDYAHLLPLYETIFKLEPTFAAAWDFALYDILIDMPQREEEMSARLRWVKKGFLRGLEGVRRTPHTSRVAGTLSWAFFFIKTRFPSIAAQIENDEELLSTFRRWLLKNHPDIAARLQNDLRTTKQPLNLFHIALCFGEIASQRRPFNYIPIYIVSFSCRELMLAAEEKRIKIYWARRAIEHWRRFLEHSDLADTAREQEEAWRYVLSALEVRK